MKIISWVGTALLIIAYYPQIQHLLVERCAWGISIFAWSILFVASALLLIYCITGNEILMSIVQVISTIAIGITILLMRRGNRICSYHRKLSEAMAPK